MVYPRSFLRLVVSGSLYGVERFSWSLSLIAEGFTPPPPSEVPQAIIDAVTTFHTSPGMAVGAPAVLDLIKLNEIGENGRYLNSGETVLAELDPPVPGVAGQGTAPQISLCVSLATARSRGRAHAGRFYPPLCTHAVQADGGISPTQQANAAEAAATLIEDINAWDPTWQVGVTSDIGAGTQNIVTAVRIGQVLDTMRSRRKSIPEEYLVRPLT